MFTSQSKKKDRDLQDLIKEVRETYIQGFMNRYKVSPKIDVRFSSIIMQFTKENGAHAPAMMKIFIESDNPYYIKNYHAEKLAQFDSKKLWAQAHQQGQGIPFADAKTQSQKDKELRYSLNHDFDKKDYRAGVDKDGRLID